MIRLTAHAKINWFLEITGKRPDGYHTLETVFQTISLGDRLTLKPAATLTLHCSDASLPTDERNLALKAAVRLRALLKEKRGAAIHLEKKVPMGAGLGGGSADAAAVIKGLLQLWGRRIGGTEVRRLAVSLGADVPFFLKGGRCKATGIGEKLTLLKPLPKTWLVIVWPGFGVSTKDAYAKVKWPLPNPVPSPLPSPGFAGRGKNVFHPRPPQAGEGRGEGALFNRFESLVFPDHPELPALKQKLLDLGCSAALMSGSGSAMYGVVPTAAQGKRILAQLRDRYKTTWLVHTL